MLQHVAGVAPASALAPLGSTAGRQLVSASGGLKTIMVLFIHLWRA